MKTERDIRDKIIERIQRLQVKTGKSVKEIVSSISISLDDYDILRQYDPSCFYCSKPNSWMPDTYRGMKMNLTKKVTRVNTKWSEQSKFSNRVKRRRKNCWSKIIIPKIGGGYTFPPIDQSLYSCHSIKDSVVTIDYSMKLQKPIDHITVGFNVTS